jgi:hypothetical protein
VGFTMSDDKNRLASAIEAIKAAEPEAELPPSLEERSRRLALACLAAGAFARDRRRAGLPEPKPEPWPASTWEFLAKHARRRAPRAINVCLPGLIGQPSAPANQ